MRVALTGGSGQLGTLVLRRLIADSAVRSIVALDLRPPLVADAKVEVRIVDVRDPDLGRHLAGCDIVVHLAFIVAERAEPRVYEAVNVEGSRNVITAAQRAGVSQIIFASSLAAYGVMPGHPVPLTEDCTRRLQTDFPYAAAKYRVEEFLDSFEMDHPALRVVRLRPAIMLGRRMANPLGRALRRGWVVGGRAPLPLVWDEDVADALLATVRQRSHGAFNLAADEPLPASDLARAVGLRHLPLWPRTTLALARVAGALGRLGIGRYDPAWLVHVDAPLLASSARARAELAWTPQCNTAIDVVRKFLATVPRTVDRRILVFLHLAGLFGRLGPRRPAWRGAQMQIHLWLTGPRGGDFGILVSDGRFRVTRRPPRPPAATITLPADLFVELLAGRCDWSTAQLTAQCHTEGDAQAPRFVSALISSFRATIARPGARGRLAHWLDGWIAGTGGG